MKNPLARVLPARRKADPDGAPDVVDDGDSADAEAVWTEVEGDVAPVPDASDAPDPSDPAADPAADPSADDGPSLGARLSGLLSTTKRAYLVVAAVALLVGPSAGATVRARVAPVPAAAPVVEDEPLNDVDPADYLDAEAVDDGRRRYLVTLSLRTASTTTTAARSGTTAGAASTTTTTTMAAPETTVARPPATLPPSPIAVTILPGEETHWVDVVRLNGKRLVVLLPVRYLRLVRDTDPAHVEFSEAIGTDRSLVRDRDGRYWATSIDGIDPTLYELGGQLPDAPDPVGEDGHADDTHATDDTHADDTHADDTHASDDDGHATDDTHASDGDGHATDDAHATDDTHATDDAHAADGHAATKRASTLPTIARSTTTTLVPGPAALIEPVPLAEREMAIALASVPGVEEVRALGAGVYAVVGTMAPEDLEAVMGVASVRLDALWRSPR